MNDAVLSIDPGRLTGWAIKAIDRPVRSGQIELEGRGIGALCSELQGWLDVLGGFDLPIVIYEEQPSIRNIRTRLMLAGYTSHIESWAHDRALQCFAINNKSCKVWACGSGKADKADMIRAAGHFFPGQKIESDNQADALCQLAYFCDLNGGGPWRSATAKPKSAQ